MKKRGRRQLDDVDALIDAQISAVKARGCTFSAVFRAIAAMNDRIFAEQTDGHKIRTLTYLESCANAAKLGCLLQRRLGPPTMGSYIALHGENSPRWIELFWAILWAGRRPLLLNTRMNADMNEQILRRMNVACVLSDGAEFSVKTLLFSEMLPEDAPPAEPGDERWENHIAVVTSGTSGNPKVCVFDGGAICEQIFNSRTVVTQNRGIAAHVNGRLKLLAFLPFYHVFGLIAVYFWFAVFGRTFVFLGDYKADAIASAVRRVGVTHIFAVPLLWNAIAREITYAIETKGERIRKNFRRLVDVSIAIQSISPELGAVFARKAFGEIRKKTLGDSVRFCVTGGGAVSDYALRLINAIGYPLYNGYGMSEIGIASVELRGNIKKRLLGTIGKPFKSVEYHISDAGELEVSGLSVARRIIPLKGEIADVGEGRFGTGDIVRVDEEGFYYLNGRLSDVIIGEDGENINPDVIERGLGLVAPAQICYLGLPGERGERPALILEMHRYSSRQNIQKAVREARDALRGMGRRDEVRVTFDALLEQGDIKPVRAKIRARAASGEIRFIDGAEYSGEVANGGVEHPLAREVCALMANALRVSAIEDVNADFFSILGGNSLDYMLLISSLEERFSVKYEFSSGVCVTALDFCRFIEENAR
jgi:long-subunit acyl-CoA synthetase (AMP-forming)/acyl carrier protein